MACGAFQVCLTARLHHALLAVLIATNQVNDQNKKLPDWLARKNSVETM